MDTRRKVDKTIIANPDRPPSGLKRFGLYLLDLPATVLSFLIFIVGAIPNAVAYVVNAIYDFCVAYKRELSIALWIGLGIAIAAGIAGLVMAIWFPAALAAVTGFSVLGYSIAMIAGESALFQVLLGTGLALAAADLALLALATVFIGIKETFEWIRSGFSSKDTTRSASYSFANETPLYSHDNMQTEEASFQSFDEPAHVKSPIKNNLEVELFDENNDFDDNHRYSLQ